MMPFVKPPEQGDETIPLVIGTTKPTKADDYVAKYEDPWSRPWFQDYMDSQPAPGAHTLESRFTGYLVEWHWEWGDMKVRGELASAANPDNLGTIVIGVNEEGEPTLAIKW